MLVSIALQLLLLVGIAWSYETVAPLEYAVDNNGAQSELDDSSVDFDEMKRAGSWNKLHGGWGKRAENWNRLNAVWGEYSTGLAS